MTFEANVKEATVPELIQAHRVAQATVMSRIKQGHASPMETLIFIDSMCQIFEQLVKHHDSVLKAQALIAKVKQ